MNCGNQIFCCITMLTQPMSSLMATLIFWWKAMEKYSGCHQDISRATAKWILKPGLLMNKTVIWNLAHGLHMGIKSIYNFIGNSSWVDNRIVPCFIWYEKSWEYFKAMAEYRIRGLFIWKILSFFSFFGFFSEIQI